ncbi:MAG: hypothetical protein JNN27_15290 [Planctomycetes bacterium]|nr:hypothetical protein [Planctomycetota bacterium]
MHAALSTGAAGGALRWAGSASTSASASASSAANGNHAATSACLSRCFDNFVRDMRRCRERCMECVEFIDGLCLVRNLNHACYADCLDQARTRHRACAATC